MVNISSVQALNQELAWEPEVFTHLQSFLVDVLGREVFSNAAVVSVAQFDFIIFMVEEVVDVNIVHVSLNILEVNIRFLVSIASFALAFSISLFVVILFVLVRLVFIGFLQPRMREDLWRCQPLLRVELDHPPNQVLSLLRQGAGEGEFAFENELVQVVQV